MGFTFSGSKNRYAKPPKMFTVNMFVSYLT
jgi:hypothetical protein